jgi:E3 ubiquitin-protein ligase SHPRH
VSLIPRRSSFAVSGTPAKAHVQDLIGPLRFLRISPHLRRERTWQRLLKPGFYPPFVELFGRYAVRTQKAHAEGLDIPKQTRYLVPIALGMIERHVRDPAELDAFRTRS